MDSSTLFADDQVVMTGPTLARRAFLAGGLGAAALPFLPRYGQAANEPIVLHAAPAVQALAGGDYPKTEIWAFNGAAPGPLLRYRQGDRLQATLRNGLAQGTTVHFHGIRMPVAMDGVPGLTQDAVATGGTFDYDFDLPDAGTFWYHPHANSAEQVGRGLYGALIVEELEPPAVDRDLLWVLDDWRLDAEARIPPFGHRHDESHQGRLGNTVTVNGDPDPMLRLRAGERVRLRLVNAANARVFGLTFEGHGPVVVALDGQPCTPHEPEGGRVDIGPAQRADLIIDAGGDPGARFRIIDGYYARQRYRLADIVYDDAAPLRTNPLDAPVALPANPLPPPELDGAVRQEVVLAGGAMFGMNMAQGGHGMHLMGPEIDLEAMVKRGRFWALNGVDAGHDAVPEPMMRVALGRTVVLAMHNHTEWDHPMHLHGHSFRVVARNGRPLDREEWRDTVMLAPHDTAEVAFVADNPGTWMFHCHILEHQMTGMTTVIAVG
jgi:FtsP/CotA-like multicopper oxidase with cupredoxin domain